ncbi:MAG: TolB-like 6-bladed beta-propeller domain-containing protein [Alistipes sp.]|jgi:hypothetical protein|nr:TolB-like 6-bladed beta-propeller domain-containing protein [Alistipes sp.]
MKTRGIVNIFGVFVCLCIVHGCASVNNGAVEYGGTPVFDRYDTINTAILTSDLELNYPKQMFVLDTIIGIVDANAAHGYYVHLFNERGELLRRIAGEGRGPGELAGYRDCFIDKKNNTISIFNNTKIVEYNLGLLFEGATEYYRDREIPKIELAWLSNGFWLDEERFFGYGNGEDRRFVLHDGNTQAIYKDYPAVVDNAGHNKAVFGQYTVMGFDKNHSRFVQGTYIGGILDIFRITADNEIVPHQTEYIYEPIYEPVENAPLHISWGSETTIGFHALDCTDGYIYSLLNGVKGSAFKTIEAIHDPPYPYGVSIFDWDGKPVRSVVLDKKAIAIAVKDDHTAYLVVFDKGYSLVKISL